ncbi:hypothetical protein pb186bvf_019856 [Paramecium bursaria]
MNDKQSNMFIYQSSYCFEPDYLSMGHHNHSIWCCNKNTLPDPEEWPGDQAVRKWQSFVRRPKQFLRKKYPLIETINLSGSDSEIDHSLTICESYQRQQTPQEFELRKIEFQNRQATQATRNKKGKKKGPEEIFDQYYIYVKVVRLTEEMPPNDRWIASQFQMIKDRDIRDCNNSKPLSAKTYPQKKVHQSIIHKENILQNCMQKERKVQITDHIPVIIFKDKHFALKRTDTELRIRQEFIELCKNWSKEGRERKKILIELITPVKKLKQMYKGEIVYLYFALLLQMRFILFKNAYSTN